jgi:hypothetical protein
MERKARVVFFSAEALFLRCRYDFAINDKGGGAIMIES